MYDIANEGDWRWVDCWASPNWIFYNWAEGQPDNGGDVGEEDCGIIRGTDGYFQDIPCITPRKYICETSGESELEHLFYNLLIMAVLIDRQFLE